MKEETPAAASEQSDGKKEEIPDNINGYRGLRPKDRKFHAMGPKDIPHGKPEDILFNVQIQMETGHAEQMAIQVPVYITDSSETMRARVRLAQSIAQERKEDFGAAVDELNTQAQMARRQEHDARAAAQQQAKIDKLIAKGKLKVAPAPAGNPSGEPSPV